MAQSQKNSAKLLLFSKHQVSFFSDPEANEIVFNLLFHSSFIQFAFCIKMISGFNHTSVSVAACGGT
jgi:hypothetical protein